MNSRLLSVVALSFASLNPGIAQSEHGITKPSNPTAATTSVQRKTLDFSNGKRASEIPMLDAIIAPIHCSGDGVTYLDGYHDPINQKISELYAISKDGGGTHLQRKLPADYKSLFVRDFFAGDHEIVTLLEASGRISTVDGVRNATTFFLLTADRVGEDQKLTELALPFLPRKFGVLESGNILVLGIDQANRIPVLAVLDGDGTLLRRVDFDSKNYITSGELATSFGKGPERTESTTRLLDKELTAATFVPWGTKILLAQPGSTLPLHVLGDAGDERSVNLKIPDGILIQGLLATNRMTSFFVRIQRAEEFAQFTAKGLLENPTQQILEFDAFTGNLLRSFDVVGARPADTTCANDGKMTAIFYKLENPSKNGDSLSEDADKIFFSSVPQ